MIDMHSKYDNMDTNGIFNTLICIDNHVNSYINCMLSLTLFNAIINDVIDVYYVADKPITVPRT